MKRHPRTDEQRLNDILEAIGRIEACAVSDLNTFETDMMRQRAILFNLTVIGEACHHLSISFKAEYPDVMWQEFTATRNTITHEYFALDLQNAVGCCRESPAGTEKSD